MVVGAEHVDQPLETTLELVAVVGDVGGQVGRFAAVTDQHPVLVVAELGAAQPQRPVALVGVAALLEPLQRRLDLAARVEVALREPVVEADTEAVERGAHALEDQLDAAPPDGLDVAGVDALGAQALGQLGDVLAFVAVLGRLAAGHRGGDRGGEALAPGRPRR